MFNQLRPHLVKGLQKAGLNRLAHHLYYNYVHGFNTASKAVLPAIDRCLSLAAERKTLERGDYFEFGLFKGYAFWYAQQAARQFPADDLRFFGFDSFQGLPEVTGIDRTENDDFYAAQYACSKDQVVANLTTNQVDWDKTFLIEGFFNDSLTPELKQQHDMQRAAVALIDCDLYASTVDVLNFMDDLLMDQTILMMDDWNCFNRDDQRGQRRAMREFLQDRPQWRTEPLFSYGTWGQVFLLRAA